MRPEVRLLVGYLVRLVLLFFAGWFLFYEGSMPDAHIVSRIGVAILFLISQILVGEVTTVRTHVGLLIGALRAVSGGTPAGQVTAAIADQVGGGAPAVPDVQAAVDILIQSLGASDPDTRDKAHKHLMRITGESFPAEVATWADWWAENREGFESKLPTD